jgi:hypothetical protein
MGRPNCGGGLGLIVILRWGRVRWMKVGCGEEMRQLSSWGLLKWGFTMIAWWGSDKDGTYQNLEATTGAATIYLTEKSLLFRSR